MNYPRRIAASLLIAAILLVTALAGCTAASPRLGGMAGVPPPSGATASATPCATPVGSSAPTSLPLLNLDDARRAIALTNGEVLIISRDASRTLYGGTYDPATDQFTPIGLSSYRNEFDWLFPLPQGRAIGGIVLDNVVLYAEYDPTARQFGPLATLPLGSRATSGAHAALLSPSELLLVSNERAWRVQTERQTVTPTAPKQTSAATILVQMSDGRVMALVGVHWIADFGTATTEAEIYNPQRDEWRAIPAIPGGIPGISPDGRERPPEGYSATVLRDGRVLLAGGKKGSAIRSWVGTYEPASNTWVARAPLPLPLAWHRATLLKDGSILFTGGRNNGGSRGERSAYIYDPAEDRGRAAGQLLVDRSFHGAVSLPNNRVLLLQGTSSDAIISPSEIYTPPC